jgi:ATP-dependent DNA helicase RecG
MRDISQAVSNHIEPKVYPQIELVYIDDKQCVRVAFSGEEAPYFAYGRAYIRVADEDRVLSPVELENFFLRKIERNDPWDDDVSDVVPSDIDESEIRDFMERANQAERIDFTYTNNEDVLNRLNLIKGGKVKNAAVALFRGFPLLEAQMAIFASTERLTFNDISRSSGNITKLATIAERYIRNNIRWRVVFDGSLQRKEIPEIPMDAVREAIINSFCHRDYTSSQNNEIVIYSNRIEIYNPGTFPEGLSPNDFIEGTGYSVKRNPLLAQLLYYVKDIESFGTGLKRISEACKTAGVEVEFSILKMGFAVIFYRPEEPVYSDTDVDVNVGVNVGVNETQQNIMELLSINPHLTAQQLSDQVGITKRRIESNIKTLKELKLIERHGAAKNGYWAVLQPIKQNHKDDI